MKVGRIIWAVFTIILILIVLALTYFANSVLGIFGGNIFDLIKGIFTGK